MANRYNYAWYIQHFEHAKIQAKEFILSVDENYFFQPPAEDRWSISECFDHLIKHANLFYPKIAHKIESTNKTTNDPNQPFPPGWIAQRIINFFEPPYRIKIKTVSAIKPDPVKKHNRTDLLDKYIDLQDRLISQLKKGRQRNINLGASSIRHPFFKLIRMTLTECFAVIEVHQRRHLWQAEQTLRHLKK